MIKKRKTVICKKCKRRRMHCAKGKCYSCFTYGKQVHTYIMGRQVTIYVNGLKKELAPLVPKIRDKVLKDCIKNPKKYLGNKNE